MSKVDIFSIIGLILFAFFASALGHGILTLIPLGIYLVYINFLEGYLENKKKQQEKERLDKEEQELNSKIEESITAGTTAYGVQSIYSTSYLDEEEDENEEDDEYYSSYEDEEDEKAKESLFESVYSPFSSNYNSSFSRMIRGDD